jgi:hypothetical protein
VEADREGELDTREDGRIEIHCRVSPTCGRRKTTMASTTNSASATIEADTPTAPAMTKKKATPINVVTIAPNPRQTEVAAPLMRASPRTRVRHSGFSAQSSHPEYNPEAGALLMDGILALC